MKNDPVLKILTNARDLLRPRGAWIKGVWAITAKGNGTDATSRSAACFCADGALHRAAKGRFRPSLGEARASLLNAANRIEPGFGWGSIICWNDSHARKKAEVLKAFKAAIEDRKAHLKAQQVAA
jgi:hypothetical protein